MKNKFSIILFFTAGSFLISELMGCNQQEKKEKDTVIEKNVPSPEISIERGRYLSVVGQCNDCHSPKKMTPMGPAVDTLIMLSGSPANAPVLPADARALKGELLLITPDITSFEGPWGISFAANLTPDSATGIGAWSEDVFIKTLRTGKHLGQEGGRPILPPMPWPAIKQMSDADIKSLYMYLQSLQPIRNQVHAPVPPAGN